MISKEEQLENIKNAIEMYNSDIKTQLENLHSYTFYKLNRYAENAIIFRTKLDIINKEIKEIKEKLECPKKP